MLRGLMQDYAVRLARPEDDRAIYLRLVPLPNDIRFCIGSIGSLAFVPAASSRLYVTE